MKSTAATVDEYLNTLPPDRREAISAVRKVILANLPVVNYVARIESVLGSKAAERGKPGSAAKPRTGPR